MHGQQVPVCVADRAISTLELSALQLLERGMQSYPEHIEAAEVAPQSSKAVVVLDDCSRQRCPHPQSRKRADSQKIPR